MFQTLKIIFAWKTSLNQNRDVEELMNICDAKWCVSSFLQIYYNGIVQG